MLSNAIFVSYCFVTAFIMISMRKTFFLVNLLTKFFFYSINNKKKKQVLLYLLLIILIHRWLRFQRRSQEVRYPGCSCLQARLSDSFRQQASPIPPVLSQSFRLLSSRGFCRLAIQRFYRIVSSPYVLSCK